MATITFEIFDGKANLSACEIHKNTEQNKQIQHECSLVKIFLHKMSFESRFGLKASQPTMWEVAVHKTHSQ